MIIDTNIIAQNTPKNQVLCAIKNELFVNFLLLSAATARAVEEIGNEYFHCCPLCTESQSVEQGKQHRIGAGCRDRQAIDTGVKHRTDKPFGILVVRRAQADQLQAITLHPIQRVAVLFFGYRQHQGRQRQLPSLLLR